MPNETQSSTSFPQSQQDVNNLKQTATDAVNDLGSTASGHVSRAKDQLKDLAGHVQQEGSDHLKQVKGSLDQVLQSARDYAADRPLTCVGAAFAAGFLFGILRSGSSRD
jgi:ElaB/YqjD/DUF883 family membrane-anchored ribosome-binding protein